MGYPPLPSGPYGPPPPYQQPPYGMRPGQEFVADAPPPSPPDNRPLVLLLAAGVPLLLLGACAAVVMVLTDTGRPSVLTGSEGATMVITQEPLPSEPPAAGDAVGQPPADPWAQLPPADTSGQPGTDQAGITPPTGQPAYGQPSPGQPAVNPPASGQPATSPPAAGQPPAGGGTTNPGAQGQTARVGGALTLQGTDPALKVSVTLNRVVNPATPASDFLKPQTGNKLAAVEITLTNAGQAVYADAPTTGAWLIDAEGQQYRFSLSSVTEGQSFGGTVTVNAGDSRKGVIVFEVPEAARLTKFQFGLNYGIADQKGEWTLS
ncbi:DUF4352 domain-containing protein [Nonomuraea sp. PA05]|uniref:DUF4352 domain-containing protein n=1 Tax=Nonomuraea sp. PA05 TaxID=2604466 RepID=UPI0011D4D13B|nr:DUF4352 domain-containing protein [Nonomuraea sp. PA05]TYB63868.1 DUF4352 domain-containing protein [Nonomuraea sp. PA05]